MNNENMTYQDLLQIVELIKSTSHFKEFHLKVGELELDIKRELDTSLRAESKNIGSGTKQDRDQPRDQQISTQPATVNSPAAVPLLVRGALPDYPLGAVLIKSPMVGTFYRAPEPGAQPFVKTGQCVDASATVCLIEVMKLINSIPAGQKGTITHILLEDGEPVEYGQLLMIIDPDNPS